LAAALPLAALTPAAAEPPAAPEMPRIEAEYRRLIAAGMPLTITPVEPITLLPPQAIDLQRIEAEYERLRALGALPSTISPTNYDTPANVLWSKMLPGNNARAEIARRMGFSYPQMDPNPPSSVTIWGPGGYAEQVLFSLGGFTRMPGLTPARGIPLLRPTGMPNLLRPYLRDATRSQIEAAALRSPDGRFRGLTGQPIDGPYDIGHIPGREHWRLVAEAGERGMTQAEFNNWVNSHPEWFRIESRAGNQSHGNEMPP